MSNSACRSTQVPWWRRGARWASALLLGCLVAPGCSRSDLSQPTASAGVSADVERPPTGDTIAPRPGPPPPAPQPVQRAIAYLESPNETTLETLAAACVSSPGTPVNSHIAAFVARQQGDDEKAERILRERLPGRRSEHEFFFVVHRAELLDLLTLQLTEICALFRLNLPADDDATATCPISGDPYVVAVDEAGRRRFSCTHCDGLRGSTNAALWPAFQQVMWPSHGEQRIEGWRGGGEAITPEQFLRDLGITSGMVVADIGAGEGYFTFPLADVVGPSGTVYSEDIDASYAALVDYRAQREGYHQIESVIGATNDVRLPVDSLDVAFVCEVYKYVRMAPDPLLPWDPFDDGIEPTFSSILRALKADGTLILVEHASRGAKSGDVTAEQMIEELERVGFGLKRLDERFRPTQEVIYLSHR